MESQYLGVHEFKPHVRGESFTKQFYGSHPSVIEKSLTKMNERIQSELNVYNKNIDICWANKESYLKMLDGARGIIFPRLLDSDHVGILNELINLANPQNLIDLGCCSAEASLLAKTYKYTGADLAEVIENVSKIMHPELDYVAFDAYNSDFQFLKDYDVILMNAFIDVLENGDVVFDKILKNSKKVILHRQSIADKTYYEIKDSYGAKTYKFLYDKNDFENTLKRNNFVITHMFQWNNSSYSFLLVKQLIC